MDNELNGDDAFDPVVFIKTLAEAHRDNLSSEYVKTIEGGGSRPITTFNRFIFEFFIFNALYAVDWQKTIREGKKILLDEMELKKQNKFLKFLKTRVEAPRINKILEKYIAPFSGEEVGRNFESVPPLVLSRDMTRSGREFFDYLRTMNSLVGKKQIKGKFFSKLTSSLIYITTVRNDIFHGNRPLGDDWDTEQESRVTVYTSVLAGTNALFFSLMLPGWEP